MPEYRCGICPFVSHDFDDAYIHQIRAGHEKWVILDDNRGAYLEM